MWISSNGLRRELVLFIGTLVLLGACEREKGSTRSDPAQLDACSLLTKEEVQAVQGSQVTEAKSSRKAEVFHTSQCYYATADASQSVSLVITQVLGNGQRSPTEFWKETFGRYDNDDAEEEEEREQRSSGKEERGEKEHEAELKPKKIEGLGDSAYWTGDRFGGALYVLKGMAYMRISLGGRDSDENKISKSKTLAAKVLSRF